MLEAFGAPEAQQALDALDASLVASYQPYWVVRALTLERAGRVDEARSARELAVGLTADPAGICCALVP